MSSFFKSPVVLLFTVYFVFGFLYDSYLWTLPSHTTAWNYWMNFVFGSMFTLGGIYGIYHAFKSGISSSIGRALFLIGAALVMWALGQYLWGYYNLVLGVEVPYPSWVDPLLLSFYFLLGAGVIILIKLFSPSITKRVVLDSAALGLVSGAIIIFIMRPDLSPELPTIIKVLNVLYPLGTAILVALTLIIMRIGGGSIRNSFPLFAVGLVIHALTAFIYGYSITNGTYWNGGFVELAGLVSGYFLSIGLAKIIYNYNSKPASS